MTTLYSSNFDTTPPADETTATTAAHTSGGAGTGLATVTIGTGGAGVKWDSDTPHTGTRSLRIDCGSPASFTIIQPYSGTAKNSLFSRFYIRFGSVPTANTIFASTTTGIGQLQIRTDGTISIRNNTSSVGISTTVFAANTWYGLQWGIDVVGQKQALLVYDATYSDLRETVGNGTNSWTQAAPTKFTIGNVSSAPNSFQMWVDDINVDDTAYPGPLGSPQPTYEWRYYDSGWQGAIAKYLEAGSYVG